MQYCIVVKHKGYSSAFVPHIVTHNVSHIRGRSQTTFTDFWPFLTPPPPWLTALLNEIGQIYLER